MNKVNQTNLHALMAHVRHILAPNTEVRRVTASDLGVGFCIDSREGEKEHNIVHFTCTPTDPEDGQAKGGWNILAHVAGGWQFVGEWCAQGESLNADWHAAWVAVMANCSGHNYWLAPVEGE